MRLVYYNSIIGYLILLVLLTFIIILLGSYLKLLWRCSLNKYWTTRAMTHNLVEHLSLGLLCTKWLLLFWLQLFGVSKVCNESQVTFVNSYWLYSVFHFLVNDTIKSIPIKNEWNNRADTCSYIFEFIPREKCYMCSNVISGAKLGVVDLEFAFFINSSVDYSWVVFPDIVITVYFSQILLVCR